MRKILFAAYSLDVGGIEKSLITLLNQLIKRNYDITLVLEKKEGIFLEQLDSNIKVIEYRPSEDKIILIRKIKNLIKRIKFIKKYKNRFIFSACFATYSCVASFTSRVASKNSYLWGHADYLSLFQGNEEEMKQFFEKRKYNQFKKIIFVSKEGEKSFIKVFPNMEKKTIVCNNLLEDKKIKELAQKAIPEKKSKCTTFINVGRHDEKQKKLSRIIEASNRLKKEGYNFKILLVGDGPETDFYKEKVKENELTDEIKFLGRKENPYPYFEIADCVLLSSDYEGYPVVFLESFILKKPIITTKVSDYKEVEGKYGLVAEKNSESLYQQMKKFINEGFEIKEEFDSKRYNEQVLTKIEKLIEGE